MLALKPNKSPVRQYCLSLGLRLIVSCVLFAVPVFDACAGETSVSASADELDGGRDFPRVDSG